MIIVAGTIRCRPGTRDEFVQGSLEAVEAARAHPECLDFAVSGDPVEPDRVNIFEMWTSLAALTAFREEGPAEDLSSRILEAAVRQYEVAS
ncbi:MAG: hypothetical protein DHS20C21_02810 [Gemmatimonadota bacterium]|nr:MAG: hypothetical protein DHS20C21_02810 [Gemmatimonadota bacterium]